MRLFFQVFSVFLLSVVVLAQASADYISPLGMKVQTTHYRPQINNLKPGTYSYHVSWQGIPVGLAEVVIHRQAKMDEATTDRIAVEARAKTNKGIDVFYRLRHRSESVFDSETFTPVSFISYQTENSRQRFRKVTFRPDGNIQSTLWKNGEEEFALDFNPKNQTLDPIAAAFLAKSLDVKVGDKTELDVFNGKHRYLISFDVQGRELCQVGEKIYDTFRVVPSVKKLTDSEGEKRLKSATLWVTADENREIVRLESKVLIGKVVAQLLQFRPVETKDKQLLAAPVPLKAAP